MKRKLLSIGTVLVMGVLVFVISGFNGCIFLPGDLVRGGLLYDKWWNIPGVLDSNEPTGDHPLYPAVGEQSGSSTWRCKECHGWDYMGVDGAYGSGSHFTDINGIYDSRNDTVRELTEDLSTGEHDFSTQLSDQDKADLVAFVTTGLVDMSAHIDLSTKEADGDATNGETLYSGSGQCVNCHGADGNAIDFGDGEGVGDLARDNPWETLHKIRFGHPGSAMPSAITSGLTETEQVDILAYAQTL